MVREEKFHNGVKLKSQPC